MVTTIDSIPSHTFRSHTRGEIAAALSREEKAWHLDTCSAGEDDVLLGERESVVRDVLAHHEFTAWPGRWTLTRVTL